MTDRNKNKPGYKKTKVGWIPVEWECAKMRCLSKLTAGGTPSTKHSEYWGGSIPWMSSGELNLKRVYGVAGRITELGLKYSSTKLIPKHSVLVGLAGQGKTRGTSAINEISLCTNQSVAAIIPNEKLYYLYVYYNLDNRYLELRRLSTGDGGRGGLNLDLLGNLIIPIPRLSEQKIIAEILSTWDEGIEQTRHLIAAAKRCKKTLMQKLLIGKKRLPGFKEKWEDRLLGDLFTEREETNRPDLPLLAITGGQGILPASHLDRKDGSNDDKSLYKRICPGDIGYNTMRMWQGVNAVSQMEGIVSPAYTICTPRPGTSIEFMGYLFKFHPMVHQFWRHSQGLVNDTLNLKYHHFARITVQVPDENEQRAIAAVLKAADDEIATLESKLSALEKQKKGLMQKLLTGEIRVR